MDSRIEELAEIIKERCVSVWSAAQSNHVIQDGSQADQYRAYRRIESLALEMLEEIHGYRVNHPEEYK